MDDTLSGSQPGCLVFSVYTAFVLNKIALIFDILNKYMFLRISYIGAKGIVYMFGSGLSIKVHSPSQ